MIEHLDEAVFESIILALAEKADALEKGIFGIDRY
jgi:hypothetical protein